MKETNQLIRPLVSNYSTQCVNIIVPYKSHSKTALLVLNTVISVVNAININFNLIVLYCFTFTYNTSLYYFSFLNIIYNKKF